MKPCNYRFEHNPELLRMNPSTTFYPHLAAFVRGPPLHLRKFGINDQQISSRPQRWGLSANRASKLESGKQLRMIEALNSEISEETAAAMMMPSGTKICTVLTASTVAGQIEQSKKAVAAGADMLEIRVDMLEKDAQPNWSSVLEEIELPVIVTNRPIWEGGSSTQPETTRLQLLLDAVRLNVSYVDVELKALETFAYLCARHGITRPFTNTKLISSYHDFEKPLTMEELDNTIRTMTNAGADICKIAMMAESAMDNVTVFQAMAKCEKPCIIIAMGEFGQVSRILAGKYGAYLTFASVEEGKGSAPGQVGVEKLLGMYAFRDIKPSTAAYAVLGDPIVQSMSPLVHNLAMRKCGIDAVYVPLRVQDAYPEFVREMSKLGFDGFSITSPGKLVVMEGVDQVDEVATKIGAINTIVKQEGGGLSGFNTDWVAAVDAIEKKMVTRMEGKRIVCIGAGGAGRALSFGALARGAAHVTVVNRSRDKAEALATDLGKNASALSLEEFNSGPPIEYDVLMNSTSVGMLPKGDQSPVVKDRLPRGAVIFDSVYNPLETKLLREAGERGCIQVSGLDMFVGQAAEQFRKWFKVEPPVSEMRDAIIERLEEN